MITDDRVKEILQEKGCCGEVYFNEKGVKVTCLRTCEQHHYEEEKAHNWMRRIKAMLNSDDIKGAFFNATIHGYVMSPEIVKEVDAIWFEYEMITQQ